jgi:hypothetical protein
MEPEKSGGKPPFPTSRLFQSDETSQVGRLSSSAETAQARKSQGQEGRLAPAEVGRSSTIAGGIHPDPGPGLIARSGFCAIGTDPSGETRIGNGGNGITILDTSYVLIGGDTSADRNIISGNTGNGIEIDGANSQGNQISNNYIGTNAAGTAALGNQHGILVHVPASAAATVVEITHDLISGNRGDGIRFQGSGGSNVSSASITRSLPLAVLML